MGSLLCCQPSESEEQQKLEDQKIKIPPEIIINSKMKKAIKKMKLRKKELIYLWNCFLKIGITQEIHKYSKRTTQTTFLTKMILAKHLHQPLDIFYSNLFDRWDLDRNDQVSFDEFLIGLYKLLLSTPSKYVQYVFQTFDADGDGYLMGPELNNILEELHGKFQFHQMTATTAMLLYDRKKDGKIDLDEFEESIQNHPVLMWRVSLCKQRFIAHIASKKFWHKLYCRLHPELVSKHKSIWMDSIRQELHQCLSCCAVTPTVCLRLIQCILWPMCPCCRPNRQTQSPSRHKYISSNLQNDEPQDISLKISEMWSNTTSASKSKKENTRLQKSKLQANIFSDTHEVEKRLDLEVLGDHESSDSEIKQYVEKQTRSHRAKSPAYYY
eukprot:20077_1